MMLPNNVSTLNASQTDARWLPLTSSMKPVSQEFGALLTACADQPDSIRLGHACSQLSGEQWNRLLDLAHEHGVTALLYAALTNIREDVPSSVAHELEIRYTTNVHKSLLQARELIRVLTALQAAGVEAIPYKGLVLAELAYGDLAMRQAGDMDLLVRRSDLPRAQATARELGYVPCLRLSAEELRRYLSVGYEISFDYGSQRNLLELKWGILPDFYAVDFEMDAMFAAQTRGSFGGMEIHSLAQEDLFLVLCVHAAKHGWSNLIWLCDLSRLGKFALDWERIADGAKRLGIARVVRVTIRLANQLLDAAIAAPPALDVSADSAATRLVSAITAQLSSGQVLSSESLAYYRLMIRLRERPVDRLRFVTRLAFTPGPNEWSAIKLWGPFTALYRLVRVGRLAARLVRSR